MSFARVTIGTQETSSPLERRGANPGGHDSRLRVPAARSSRRLAIYVRARRGELVISTRLLRPKLGLLLGKGRLRLLTRSNAGISPSQEMSVTRTDASAGHAAGGRRIVRRMSFNDCSPARYLLLTQIFGQRESKSTAQQSFPASSRTDGQARTTRRTNRSVVVEPTTAMPHAARMPCC